MHKHVDIPLPDDAPASAPVDERWVGDNPVAHYAWNAEPDKTVPMAEARKS